MTTPLSASLSNESQSGTARLAALSRFLVANWRAALEFLISMTVVHLKAEGRNVDFSAVDLDVAMSHQLAGGRPGIGEAQVVNDIVQPGLQNLQHLLAGYAPAPQGAFVNATELAFHQTVIIAELLFFDQAQAVIGVFAP